tara:strand:+ start:10083 stop:10928 length:846 start_codon:yes stop_codon:yes gene_type:complete
MSCKIKVGLVQMSMSDVKGENLDKALKKIDEAASRGAEVICLPELFSTLYFPQTEDESSFELAEKISGKTSEILSESARENDVIIVGGSIFEEDNGKYYNSSLVFGSDGSMLGKYRKVHIPNDPGFYEKTFFSPGDGFNVFETPKAKIGTLICYDQWFPEAARINKLLGAEIILYPTAIGWTDSLRKEEPFSVDRWVRDQCSHASMNNVFVVSVNRVGKENDLEFWGNSFVADPFGNIIAKAGNEEEILIADIDLSLIDSAKDWGFMENRRPELYQDIIKK